MKPLEMQRELSRLRFSLMVPRTKAKIKFQTPLGEAEGHKQVYLPILDALAERPHTIEELAALPSLKGQPFASLIQAITILVHSGQIHSIRLDGEANAPDGKAAKDLNLAFAKAITIGENYSFVSVPAAGTGTSVAYAELVAILALNEGLASDAGKIAEYGWGIMERTGQRLIKDGTPLKTKEDNLKELESQLKDFLSEKLPVWRGLGVA